MSYRVPTRVLRRLGAAMIGIGETSLSGDCAEYIASTRPRPRIEGAERIPASGPFCAVANHCERRGLWIGFPSSLLVTAVADRRPGEPPIHFAVLKETRLFAGRLPVPGTAWAYGRVAGCYGMVTIPARPADRAGRSLAMRRLARLALPPPPHTGRPICIYPEGERGTSRGLTPALPGSGAFLLLLSRSGIPLLPVGFADVNGRLVGRIGSPFALSFDPTLPRRERDRAAADEAMSHVAELLPEAARGAYSGGSR